MTDRELMQQALDALVEVEQTLKQISAFKIYPKYYEAIEALRARLAQPEQQHSEQWWKHEVSNAYAEGYEKGRVMCGCGDQIMPDDGAECGNCVTARNAVKPQPVAQVHVAEDYHPHVIWAEGINAVCFDQEYLYITPPQREFIGLTDEEMMMIYGQNHEGKKYSFGRAIEAKLKEKNT